MPAYTHIERYRAQLERLIEYGGSDNESSIRRAFAVCLHSYCREHRERLALVDELEFRGGVYPDGGAISESAAVQVWAHGWNKVLCSDNI